MRAPRYIRSVVQWLAAGAGVGVVAYATYVGVAWYRFGSVRPPPSEEGTDRLLDRLMPVYEAVERHHVHVAAPAKIAFSAAIDLDLNQSAVIRAIFKGREFVLGSMSGRPAWSGALLAQLKEFGWGVLTEIPGREIVMGTVTQPWMANVLFRPLSPEEFIAFHEPGYVKIAWALRVDPVNAIESVARTETRVVTTDPGARAKFRRYWLFFSPGIVLIRRIALGLVKREAERWAREKSPVVS